MRFDVISYTSTTDEVNFMMKLTSALKNNKIVENAKWNNKELSSNEKSENFYDVKKREKNVQDCSACDYLLLLIAEIFDVTIHHLCFFQKDGCDIVTSYRD